MRIISIEISGYNGAAPDRPIELDFGNRTLLIGPNNSGKSIAMRFFHFLKKHKFPVGSTPTSDVFNNPTIWWNCDKTQPINISICVELSENVCESIPQIWRNENQVMMCFRILQTISAKEGGEISYKSRLIFEPALYNDYQWQYRSKVTTDGEVMMLEPSINGRALTWVPYTGKGFPGWFSKTTVSFCDHLHIFDPIRALDRGHGHLEANDGSALLQTFYSRYKNNTDPTLWSQTEKALLSMVNGLLKPTGSVGFDSLRMTESGSGDNRQPKLLFIKDERLLRLDEMGTGLSELILLCASLIENKGVPTIYLLEEPETHLHPGLVRRLMALLNEQHNAQFIIASHSNAIIDSLSEDDMIHHFYQDSDGACRSLPCNTLLLKHELLDSLGVSNSQLLQSNCVIWVEGPSDRFYIRWWLENYCKTQMINFVENADYSFAIYGGKILGHFNFNEEDTRDFIALAKINRFCAVVMDRDLEPDQDVRRLRKDKLAILNQADGQHFLALITDKREIENDLPFDLLLDSLSAYFEVTSSDFENFEFTELKKYNDELAEFFEKKYGDTDPKSVSVRSRASKKVAFCQAFLAKAKNVDHAKLEYPSYIPQLVELILRSRKPDEKPEKKE